jgi:hypothetical protein
MTNTPNNIVVAEFMNMKQTAEGWQDRDGFISNREVFKTLKFDTDQKWLLQVLSHIDSLNMEEYRNAEGEEHFWELPFKKLSEERFKELFEECLHFLAWWNED